MPGFDIVVLLFVGMLGVILGLVGLAARPDSVGIVLGVMVLALGLVSVWQGWRMRRSAHGNPGAGP